MPRGIGEDGAIPSRGLRSSCSQARPMTGASVALSMTGSMLSRSASVRGSATASEAAFMWQRDPDSASASGSTWQDQGPSRAQFSMQSMHPGSASFADLTVAATSLGGPSSALRTHKEALSELKSSYWNRQYQKGQGRKEQPMQSMQQAVFTDFSKRTAALKKSPTYMDRVSKRDVDAAATSGKPTGNVMMSSSQAGFRKFTPSENAAGTNLPVFTSWHTHVLGKEV